MRDEMITTTTCCICMEDIPPTGGNNACMLPACGHAFHVSCILQWADRSSSQGRNNLSCPICRKAFQKKDCRGNTYRPLVQSPPVTRQRPQPPPRQPTERRQTQQTQRPIPQPPPRQPTQRPRPHPPQIHRPIPPPPIPTPAVPSAPRSTERTGVNEWRLPLDTVVQSQRDAENRFRRQRDVNLERERRRQDDPYRNIDEELGEPLETFRIPVYPHPPPPPQPTGILSSVASSVGNMFGFVAAARNRRRI